MRRFQQGLEDRPNVRRENAGEKALPRGQGIDTTEGSWAGAAASVLRPPPLVGTAQVATIYPAGVVGLPSPFLFHILQGIFLIPSSQMRRERL